MSNLERALDLAQKGYMVFPVFESGTKFKHPRTGPGGFKNATDNPNIIAEWWGRNPGSLVGVSLDGSGYTVIDVDAHAGAISGYDVLAACGFSQSTGVSGKSVSGLGEHFWYLGQTSSGKAATSVDRKSAGGYVIVTYDLPHISEIVDDVPDWALPAENEWANKTDRHVGYTGSFEEWANTLNLEHTDLGLEQRVERKTQVPFDYSDLRDALWLAVSAGAEGAAGMPELIEGIRQRWLSGEFDTEQNRARFDALLNGAISEKGPYTGPRYTEFDYSTVPEQMARFTDADVMDLIAADYEDHGIKQGDIPGTDDPGIAEAARQIYIRRRGTELADEWDNPQSLEFVPLTELVKLAPPECVWNDMIFDSTLTVLAADGGAGKTTFTIGLALAMGNDVDLLGAPVTNGRVLFLVGEGARSFGNRVRAYEQYWHQPLDTSHVTTIPGKVLTRTLMQQVTRAHRENPYDLIVFDTFAALFSVENENDNAEMGKILRWLKELRDIGPRTVVILNHHTTNTIDGKGRKVMKARGASALRNDADTMILMGNNDGDIYMSSDPQDGGKQRDAEAKKIAGITLRKVGPGVVSALQSQRDRERHDERMTNFLKYFGSPDQEWASNDLKALVGSEKVYKGLRSLAVEAGFIEKTEGHFGKYRLTEEGYVFANF